MLSKLEDYEKIVGRGFAQQVLKSAKPLRDDHVVHINSTYYGGGVAEILNSLVMLLNDAGITTGWRLLKGNQEFFNVTKQVHNALQGEDVKFSSREKAIYLDANKANSVFTHLDHHDLVIVHDPQPLPMIRFSEKKCPWIWRCHVDISKPNFRVWNYLKKFVSRYDAAVFSTRAFERNIKIPQHIIAPAIDPLSIKNMDISDKEISRQLEKFGIPRDKPIIAQISRFDR